MAKWKSLFFTTLLAPYVVTYSSWTAVEGKQEIWGVTSHGYLKLIEAQCYSKEGCEDLAFALNEAHDRRNRKNRFYKAGKEAAEETNREIAPKIKSFTYGFDCEEIERLNPGVKCEKKVTDK